MGKPTEMITCQVCGYTSDEWYWVYDLVRGQWSCAHCGAHPEPSIHPTPAPAPDPAAEIARLTAERDAALVEVARMRDENAALSTVAKAARSLLNTQYSITEDGHQTVEPWACENLSYALRAVPKFDLGQWVIDDQGDLYLINERYLVTDEGPEYWVYAFDRQSEGPLQALPEEVLCAAPIEGYDYDADTHADAWGMEGREGGVA